jgi:glycine cleavage system H protein
MIVEDPAIVNGSPGDEGWFFRLELDDVASFETLMDEDAYAALLETL